MAYIRVDHNKFENAASAIDSYISRHKKNMKKVDQEVANLATSWQGKDYETFKIQWNELNASDSISTKMLNILKNYAEYLRMAAKKYKEAQTNAVNRANNLPRW